MAKLPFAVERVQTDNGSEFGASFHWHLLDAGVVYESRHHRGKCTHRILANLHSDHNRELLPLLDSDAPGDPPSRSL